MNTNFNIEARNSFNQRVDNMGVLHLIQQLDFNEHTGMFEIVYFTGWKRHLLAQDFCSGIDEGCSNLTFRQMHEAYSRIEEYSLATWKEWTSTHFFEFKMNKEKTH